MLSNMANSLIMYKRIETTLAKAKELRVFVEPLITKGKDDSTHSRRLVFSSLKNKYAVKELFGTVSEKVGQRPGGYTRILKTGFRHGDAAEMAIIELVDFNETYTQASTAKINQDEWQCRRLQEEARSAQAYTPLHRKRVISNALQVYASMVSSADKGAVRVV
ncbi:50S ribosomal protein L17 [Bacteroidia bacterium]|nr:50S ribosomal protein L17 [Bacteroidia bacterium]